MGVQRPEEQKDQAADGKKLEKRLPKEPRNEYHVQSLFMVWACNLEVAPASTVDPKLTFDRSLRNVAPKVQVTCSVQHP